MSTINLGDVLTCAETGKQFVAAPDGCSRNYATGRDGSILSDEGVHIRQCCWTIHCHSAATCQVMASALPGGKATR
jgi:hypothetical protein